jgi:4-hydroxy-3-methylbut-2-en-1-yl diphosphate synthase IspG/GcpE
MILCLDVPCQRRMYIVYPLQLGATEAQQTTVSVLRSVPATLKIAFGFLSDTVRILTRVPLSGSSEIFFSA